MIGRVGDLFGTAGTVPASAREGITTAELLVIVFLVGAVAVIVVTGIVDRLDRSRLVQAQSDRQTDTIASAQYSPAISSSFSLAIPSSPSPDYSALSAVTGLVFTRDAEFAPSHTFTFVWHRGVLSGEFIGAEPA